jgi:SAM-dependent methyltransferase
MRGVKAGHDGPVCIRYFPASIRSKVKRVTGMAAASDPRLYHAHVARNRAPILDVLKRVLPARGLVVEVASGGGEHAVFFAQGLPHLRWQPTDIDAGALASIAAHRAAAEAPNLLTPLRLDTKAEPWPVARADAVVCNNMIHISPWAVSEGLVAGAGRIVPAGGVLYLYGPYKIGGRHTAPSNQDFDTWLRAQTAGWGVRDLADVTNLAAHHGFALAETVPMPANNLSVVFRRV